MIFFIDFLKIIIHYSLKSDYSLFINFFFYSLKIGLFIIFRQSLFTIYYFVGSLFTIHYKKWPLFTNHYTPSRPSYKEAAETLVKMPHYWKSHVVAHHSACVHLDKTSSRANLTLLYTKKHMRIPVDVRSL